jgi:hypothetical protein
MPEDPEVAIITAIYVVNGNILTFKAKCCKIRDYLPHYRAKDLHGKHIIATYIATRLIGHNQPKKFSPGETLLHN